MLNGINIGVLALQGAVTEHRVKLQQCGVTATEVKTPEDLEALDGLIIPGGESTTIGMLMQKYKLNDAVKNRCREGMPVMGTCAGLVLLAKKVVDGKPEQPKLDLMDITVKRNAFGRQKESFEKEVYFQGLDKPVRGVFIRAPLVVETGNEVEVLSALEEGMVAVRQENLLGISFHPELSEGTSLHRYFLDMVFAKNSRNNGCGLAGRDLNSG